MYLGFLCDFVRNDINPLWRGSSEIDCELDTVLERDVPVLEASEGCSDREGAEMLVVVDWALVEDGDIEFFIDADLDEFFGLVFLLVDEDGTGQGVVSDVVFGLG